MKMPQRTRPVMNRARPTSTASRLNGSKVIRGNKHGTHLLPVLCSRTAATEAAYHEVMSDANAAGMETKDIKMGDGRAGNGGQHTLTRECCG